MRETALETHSLSKEYDNGRGCRDVTISIGKGEAFGFLGPNGAGKSTFVKMLVGLIAPTSGQASIFGHRIGSLEAKASIGYLPELYRYQEWLTGAEVLQLHAKLCRMDAAAARRRIPELLEEVGLGLRGKDRVKHYSKGMQQRLGLACALVHEPQLVFLDEPSSALDPVGRAEVRGILERLKAQGVTIFLNSHLLGDVEALCDRMALLNDGVILRHGTVSELLSIRSTWLFKVGGCSPYLLSWLQEATGLVIRHAAAQDEGSKAEIKLGTSADNSIVWLEAELDNEEQAGWLNALIMEQGMILYEAIRHKERLEGWFMDAVSGLSHRGEGK
ncbi:putative ABC transporter ATP-binding protein YxlF [compost metagenome]